MGENRAPIFRFVYSNFYIGLQEDIRDHRFFLMLRGYFSLQEFSDFMNKIVFLLFKNDPRILKKQLKKTLKTTCYFEKISCNSPKNIDYKH